MDHGHARIVGYPETVPLLHARELLLPLGLSGGNYAPLNNISRREYL